MLLLAIETLKVVLRRDMSLNRRLYAWIQGMLHLDQICTSSTLSNLDLYRRCFGVFRRKI
jgi:hypothetical protein